MKSFVISAGVLIILTTGISGSPHPPHRGPPHMTGEMKKNFEECLAENGITLEEERELHRKHDFNNEKIRCIPACIMKKNGFLEEGNKLQIDKILQEMSQRFEPHDSEEAKEIIEGCQQKAMEEKNECDFARTFQKCKHNRMGPPKPPKGPKHMTEEMKKNFDECLKENNLTKEEQHELHRKHEFNNEKIRCMPACLMKKDGFLEEGNRVNVENMTKSTSERHGHKPEEVKVILEECLNKDIPESDMKDECDFAKNYLRCIHTGLRRYSSNSRESDQE